MRNKVRKVVELDQDKLDKIQELFPGLSYWAVIDQLLGAFIQEYEDNPIDYAKLGAKRLKDLFDGEKI